MKNTHIFGKDTDKDIDYCVEKVRQLWATLPDGFDADWALSTALAVTAARIAAGGGDPFRWGSHLNLVLNHELNDVINDIEDGDKEALPEVNAPTTNIKQ